MNDNNTFTIEPTRRRDYHAGNAQARPKTNAERHEARQRRGERHVKNQRREQWQLDRAGAL